MRVPKPLRSHLSEADLDRIAEAIAAAEKTTSGELRVHVVARLLPLENARRRAIREFFRLGMDRTKDSSGVLLFVAARSSRFEIVADKGINEKIEPGVWREIASEITDHIHEKGLGDGLEHGVHRISGLLASRFPVRSDDVNELPDEVSFG